MKDLQVMAEGKLRKAKTVPAVNLFKVTDDYIYFTVCLLGIEEDNYTTEYTAVPYITYMQDGEMVTEYDNWCFDESRKHGDTGIISTSFGYHIMFFCEDNISNWQINYFNTATDEAASEVLAEMQKNHTINADINKIYAIPEVK